MLLAIAVTLCRVRMWAGVWILVAVLLQPLQAFVSYLPGREIRLPILGGTLLRMSPGEILQTWCS